MEEQIALFLSELERKKHILELLKNINLSLTIEVDNMDYGIVFCDGSIARGWARTEGISIFRISGHKEAIYSLLNGNLKLRDGIANEILRVSGSFRSLLMLESIFILAGSRGLLNVI